MEAYTGFAQVYDTFMDDTPYEEWAEYLSELLHTYGVADGEAEEKTELAAERNTVVDLGCGTGVLTELLSDAGYDMIGIDNSDEMLAVALARRECSGKDILYLHQDMRELELYGAAGAIVSVCDSINYILEEEELLDVFRRVNNYLYPGGVFIFDFNTVYKYETVIGDATIAENREDCSFIWENCYDVESGINEYDLTVFVKDIIKGQSGANCGRELFERFTETHFQRGYTPEQMCSLIKQAGMELIQLMDADTHGEVHAQSERIYVVAREAGKEPVNE